MLRLNSRGSLNQRRNDSTFISTPVPLQINSYENAFKFQKRKTCWDTTSNPQLRQNFMLIGTQATQLIGYCYVFQNYLLFNWLNSISFKEEVTGPPPLR